jgi:hypothetical protein
MKDPKKALLFLQDLESEPIGILESGVLFPDEQRGHRLVCVRKNKSVDWV